MAETIRVEPPQVFLTQADSLHAGKQVLPQLLEDLRPHGLPEGAVANAQENSSTGFELLEAHRPRICFSGKTVCGKTSLMNAVLGKQQLPAEDTGKVVTTVTEVVHDPTSIGDESVPALRQLVLCFSPYHPLNMASSFNSDLWPTRS